ncbi:DUF6245 family protein [Streptosporangium saharense]|uniref:DUF6245 family protein n=1 Tax=Streptosporangium saharense TaxID=1706840 RepID=UPI00342B23DB
MTAEAFRAFWGSLTCACARSRSARRRRSRTGYIDGQEHAAHRQQLIAAGADDAGKLAEFLRWQTVRVAGPLRQIAQDPSTGPIPVAAAHAADGLQRLLSVIAGGQVPSVEGVAAGIAEMKAARQALLDGVAK